MLEFFTRYDISALDVASCILMDCVFDGIGFQISKHVTGMIVQEQGKMEECFLDLRRAQTYAPEMPGLWEGLADAAERCMRRRDGEDGVRCVRCCDVQE